MAEVREHSDAVRIQVAAHLRRAILEEMNLQVTDVAPVMAPPYDKPGHLRTAKYLRGFILAPSDTLEEEGQAYPFLSWKTKFRKVVDESTGDIKFKIDETITPRLAQGASFKATSIEVWGGQESTMKRDVV